jgi:CheY-like chemotaxis protein
LFAEGTFSGRDVRELPSVVFLDINLPKLNGLEVLRRIRADQRTALLPIVLLTSSDEQRDVLEAYRQGANSFIRKPYDFNEFITSINALGNYWLDLNLTPHDF